MGRAACLDFYQTLTRGERTGPAQRSVKRLPAVCLAKYCFDATAEKSLVEIGEGRVGAGLAVGAWSAATRSIKELKGPETLS